MKSWIAVLAALIACGATPAKDEARVAARTLGADLVVAGDAPSVTQPVDGDLMAAGGTVDVLADVHGDAMLAGGTLRIERPIGQSVYASGGRITIAAPVQRNVRFVGGTLEIASAARVAGNVSAAGGELRVLGPVGGYVVAAAGRVLIDAPVQGDVDLRAGRIELGPRAAIGGRLRHAGDTQIVRDPAATVAGGIEPRQPPSPAAAARGGPALSLIWNAGLVLLAAVCAALLQPWYGRVQRALAQRPAASAAIGFAGLVCTPVLALLLIVTIVGAPLGLLTLLAYPMLALVGYVSVAVVGGRLALARWKPERQADRTWQALAAAACMVLVGLVASLPWIGVLGVLAAVVLGTGALLLAFRSDGRRQDGRDTQAYARPADTT